MCDVPAFHPEIQKMFKNVPENHRLESGRSICTDANRNKKPIMNFLKKKSMKENILFVFRDFLSVFFFSLIRTFPYNW